MSHTEQMREALAALDAVMEGCQRMGGAPGGWGKITMPTNAAMSLVFEAANKLRAALTAPAAEVPDSEIDKMYDRMFPAPLFHEDRVKVRKFVRAILALRPATAAEVPEAMGDEPALPEPAWFALDTPGADADVTFFADRAGLADFTEGGDTDPALGVELFNTSQLRTYAKQYAQWQFTRLRGGVSETVGDQVAVHRSVLEHMMLIAERAERAIPKSAWSKKAERRAICKAILADKKLIQKLTAAPQAPAAAPDAGVVRDAERWRKFVSLDYKVRREWAANLSLTPVLVEWVDSLPAMSAQAGKGGAE